MVSHLSLTAVILSGGLATRLRPVIADQPKALAEVQGRPFLTFILDQLVAVKVKEVVLCTGHLGQQIRETLGLAYKGLPLRYSQESSPLGTAGALRLALPLLNSDPVLVMNGDSYVESISEDFAAQHVSRKARASTLLTNIDDTSRYGRVELDANGAVVQFTEKGRRRIGGWINAGVYLFTQSVVQGIPSSRKVSLEEEILPSLVGKGLYGYRTKGRFLDIGTPESYAAAAEFFALEARS